MTSSTIPLFYHLNSVRFARFGNSQHASDNGHLLLVGTRNKVQNDPVIVIDYVFTAPERNATHCALCGAWGAMHSNMLGIPKRSRILCRKRPHLVQICWLMNLCFTRLRQMEDLSVALADLRLILRFYGRSRVPWRAINYFIQVFPGVA